MKHIRLLYILGDLQGDFKRLNWFITWEIRRNSEIHQMADDYRKAGVDFQALIIQCGDFAYYWPEEPLQSTRFTACRKWRKAIQKSGGHRRASANPKWQGLGMRPALIL